MALPDELLNELLSAYLDGAASSDESARVEQLLRDDAAIAERLEQMRELRVVVQRSRRATPALPRDFAASVVDTAIARAESEELSSTHPLRRVAAQKTALPPGTSNWTSARLIAIVASLAAAVLVIGLVAQTEQDAERSDSPPGTEESLANGLAVENSLPKNVIGEQSQPEESRSEGSLAENTPPEEPDKGQALLADSGMRSKPSESTPTQNRDKPTSQSDSSLATAAKPLQMLMVVEVELTEAGRSVEAFNQALSNVQIEIGDEREVSDQLAQAAIDQVADEQTLNQPVPQLLLLESPAKKLDLLVNALTSNRDHIKSVGFNAISVESEPSLMKAIEAVRWDDPTAIRHSGMGMPLSGRSDPIFEALSNRIGGRDFLPIGDAQTAKMVSDAASDNGPDQMANILFLVR